MPTSAARPLVIGCGALARELVALTRRAGFPEVDLTCLPATLHNRPEQIPAAVQGRIRRAKAAGRERIFVAYADCGTGGLLDRVLEEEGVARLEGAHCYEVYAGRAAFAQLADEEPGTFYLTDFLARNFDRLVIRGLGLDRHPELLPVYFGNYTRLLYLAQTDDPALTATARRGARRLGLRFERREAGYGELASAMAALSASAARASEPALAPGANNSPLDGPDGAETAVSLRVEQRTRRRPGRRAPALHEGQRSNGTGRISRSWLRPGQGRTASLRPAQQTGAAAAPATLGAR